MKLDTHSSEVSISPRIVMDFYNRVFGLYPNITRIQDVIHEDTKTFTCIVSLPDTLSLSEQETMQRTLLDLIQTNILPVLPAGYHSTFKDVILNIPKKPDNVVLQDLCNTLQKEFPDIVEIETSIIGDTVDFSISGFISPHTKHAIRQFLIAEFPLWDQYQPRDPVFYHRDTLHPTPQSTQKSFGSRLFELLKEV